LTRKLLFICTGNFYRSRFAEALFNHKAEELGLPWKAFSRGLAIHYVPEGDLSHHTASALAERGVHLRHTGPVRVQVSGEDLQSADLVIALDDREHRPMMRELFPDWESKITFWGVSDMPHVWPEEALPAIEARVGELIATLSTTSEK